jgi:uncharacterized protein YggE
MSDMNKLVTVTLAGIAAATVLVLVAAGSTDSSPSGGITVNGSGTATTTPDRAAFSFGVTDQAPTASAALARNSDAIAKVIAALEAHGVADADLQTQSVSLSPRTSDKGDIVGYTASNTVSAQSTVAKAGETIDAAVSAGATDVSGPAFTTADEASLYRQALKAAVADAKAKAQALAAAAGVSLGDVTTVVESSSAPIPFIDRTAAPTATPVQPGTEQIAANVTVTFALA